MKVAIVYYSTYGHVLTLAKAVKEGLESSGKVSKVDILQVAETLPKNVLAQMHAPEKPNYPIATPEKVAEYDALFFGYPTRFGNLPAQLVEFFGQTGGLWASGGLHGKPVGVFTSLSSSAGGQEVTMRAIFSYVAHHGMIFIPLGYGLAFPEITNLEEMHGGTPYGASTFAGVDGSRQPTALELKIARTQGENFAASAAKFVATSTSTAAKSAPEKTARKEVASTAVADEKTETKPAAKPAPQRQQKAETPSAAQKEDSGCGVKCVIV